mgnify:CR=1 FL=1
MKLKQWTVRFVDTKNNMDQSQECSTNRAMMVAENMSEMSNIIQTHLQNDTLKRCRVAVHTEKGWEVCEIRRSK